MSPDRCELYLKKVVPRSYGLVDARSNKERWGEIHSETTYSRELRRKVLVQKRIPFVGGFYTSVNRTNAVRTSSDNMEIIFILNHTERENADR